MAYRVPRLSWLTIPVLGTLLGCGSGQTGSPSCVGTTSCICDSLYAERSPVLLRGTVMSVGTLAADQQLTLTVEELVNPEYAWDIVVGDSVGGFYRSGPSCAPNGYVPAPGDQVLAIYYRGDADHYPGCVEYQQCSSQNCGPRPSSTDSAWDACDESCINDTFASCSLHRSEALAKGTLWLAKWGDQIELGKGYSIAATELSILIFSEQCNERFPRPPNPPCNDVSVNTGCRMTSSSLRPVQPWTLAVALAAAVGMVRRRRRRRV